MIGGVQVKMWRNNIIALVTHFCVAGMLYLAFTYGGIQAMKQTAGAAVTVLMTIAGLGAFIAVGRWELQNQKSYREQSIFSGFRCIPWLGSIFVSLHTSIRVITRAFN